MYSVVNAEYLKLFDPSLLDDDVDEDTRIPSAEDLVSSQEEPLKEDCICVKGRHMSIFAFNVPSEGGLMIQEDLPS